MDLKKTNESVSPLVGRTTYIFKASFTGERTPSEEEVKKAVSNNIKTDSNLVQIDSIKQDYGSASATIEVHVYKDAEAMKKFGIVVVEKKEEKKAE